MIEVNCKTKEDGLRFLRSLDQNQPNEIWIYSDVYELVKECISEFHDFHHSNPTIYRRDIDRIEYRNSIFTLYALHLNKVENYLSHGKFPNILVKVERWS